MTSFPFFFFKTQFINVSYGDIYYGHNMDLTISGTSEKYLLILRCHHLVIAKISYLSTITFFDNHVWFCTVSNLSLLKDFFNLPIKIILKQNS